MYLVTWRSLIIRTILSQSLNQTLQVLVMGLFPAPLVPVQQTVTGHRPKCRLSANAGFFNRLTGNCFGNIVSNGRIRAVGVTGMHISNLEKGKSAPSAELVLKLAEALEANADELLYLADQVSPEVVDVIHQNPLAIPNFLRSAKNLTPEQWELLQQQVEQMTEEK